MRKCLLALLVVPLIFSLTGCLLGNDGFKSESGSVEVEPPCNPGSCTETATGNKTAQQSIPFEFAFGGSNAGPYFYVRNKPSWLSFDKTARKIVGTPTEPASITDMRIFVHDMQTTEMTGPFSLTITGDPLTSSAWHLNNLGQNGFSTGPGTSGQDIKLLAAMAHGFTGAGVTVAVSDTGVEIAHEDLTDNVIMGQGRDYSLVNPYIGDPTPPGADEGHGTSVTGLISAKGWNGIGARGIAPDSTFAGFYFLGPAMSVAKLVHQATGTFDIWNQSWGFPTCGYTPATGSYAAQIKDQALNGRAGKGVIFVKAAGNSFIDDQAQCIAITPGTMPYFGNANFDGDNTSPFTILAGAVNAKGKKSSYSTPGSNLWVAAPGGEFGDDSPAMISTDMEGCTRGLSESGSSANNFEKGQNSLNSGCNYTSTMNGTSSASPVVAGVIALMLEANSALTWRDVKHILASTSTVIETNSDNSHPFEYDFANLPYERGWTTNTAGYKFHNWFGFGRINADAAVSMADAYGASLPEFVVTANKSNETYYTSGAINVIVPDASSTGVSRTLSVLHNLVTESVGLKISVNHIRPSDLGIEIISPAGTRNWVMNYNSLITDNTFTDVIFLSNAFYGESSRGTWTVKVYDARNGVTGNLTSVSLKFFGHVDATPDETVVPGPPASITVPPMAPSLAATPTVTWTASPAADVMRYEYSVGTTSGGTEVTDWQSAGTALTAADTGLTLTTGNTYHFNVRAIDTSENVSTTVTGSFDAP